MSDSWLTALPVFNEVNYVDEVLENVLKYADHVLVVDDGSSDGTAERLDGWANRRPESVSVVHHAENRGYGAALQTLFAYAVEHGFEGVVTLDCDGQHQPCRIPEFIEAGREADIVSGSRYLKQFDGDDEPPQERMFINRRITADINRRLGFELTDAFCGFKAYRTDGLRQMKITDDGYAMPLQLWVEAAAAGLKVTELPVPLIYLDLERSFGGSLDHAETRLKYYNRVLDDAIDTACKEGRFRSAAADKQSTGNQSVGNQLGESPCGQRSKRAS
ncbi:glycosyltransferase family 2 protein [Rhodopirellula halodulae]|uniref:glycosyltransferase family 2 protein n=1 Tax=Rhodopirellula halodulae TaxID=2894198 RepID=UPI001E3F57B4|nr:glycosyltransferase family 2 protein [Rhodopirellula sp. JC737]MCC9655826.1 glycosyltransferase family 2 protein [Rhodopirellula sp. JC737]